MTKQIPLTSRPQKASNASMDAWVEGATERKPYKAPNTKRLTFDLDAEIHSQLKIHCATQRIPVTDFLRSLIEQAISRR